MLFILVLLLPALSLVSLPLVKSNLRIFHTIQVTIASLHLVLALQVPLDATLTVFTDGFYFHVDSFTKLFIILVSFSWLIALIYIKDYTKYQFQQKQQTFYFFLNLLLTVILLNASSGNLQTLLLFYAIGIPLTYPLLKIRNTTKSKFGASLFLKQTIGPLVLLLIPAMFFTNHLIGRTNFDEGGTYFTKAIDPHLGGLLLLMFILGFSKNSMFPFHRWLPSTHETPAPISALIHSVATVNTASIAIIKIALYIFGLDYIRILTSSFLTGGFIVYLAGGTAVYTAFKALRTDDLKKRFTYSTVGQLSYILLAILVGTEIGILAATLHVVTHSIAKACLFYVAGFFNSVYGTTSAVSVGKYMSSHKFIALVITICGLSITGFPFLAGFYSKDLMLLEEWHTGNYASSIFLVIGSVVNLFYILPVVKNVFKKPPADINISNVPIGMTISFIISVLLIVSSSLYMSFITLMIQV
jgi:multicomponent Na+:H+ antiporter subunit D